jgi:hypothetical protein
MELRTSLTRPHNPASFVVGHFVVASVEQLLLDLFHGLLFVGLLGRGDPDPFRGDGVSLPLQITGYVIVCHASTVIPDPDAVPMSSMRCRLPLRCRDLGKCANSEWHE